MEMTMPTIHPLRISDTDEQTAATLNAVKAKLGGVPNLIATLANSPAVLQGYLQLSETLGAGQLTARQREIVALATAQENVCGYCLSAHSLLGKAIGLSEDEIRLARSGTASTPREAAIASFARQLVKTRGRLDSGAVAHAREAGLSDAVILEIIANVALGVLTNYTNHVAGTVIDFPVVEVA
ncbi:carboxymuconolactone decarboxylase family protein [Aromatoleum toluclasticum]|uniref:carboxymuconolactone decarboxylase family protein n=1 Tax=Aromatoleum toluclasticum TaxID=92003 RepID=UPI001D193121|nr:carboxymuconolactone decarboxylase family protein [Aromatoleum toluclasticum]MCC4118138.1 carboxymuconolactone decarboxylase family protein [Aromatoleum toluclasticum]